MVLLGALGVNLASDLNVLACLLFSQTMIDSKC